MLAMMSDFLGTAWWSILCFVAGGLIGAPLLGLG